MISLNLSMDENTAINNWILKIPSPWAQKKFTQSTRTLLKCKQTAFSNYGTFSFIICNKQKSHWQKMPIIKKPKQKKEHYKVPVLTYKVYEENFASV